MLPSSYIQRTGGVSSAALDRIWRRSAASFSAAHGQLTGLAGPNDASDEEIVSCHQVATANQVRAARARSSLSTSPLPLPFVHRCAQPATRSPRASLPAAESAAAFGKLARRSLPHLGTA